MHCLCRKLFENAKKKIDNATRWSQNIWIKSLIHHIMAFAATFNQVRPEKGHVFSFIFLIILLLHFISCLSYLPSYHLHNLIKLWFEPSRTFHIVLPSSCLAYDWSLGHSLDLLLVSSAPVPIPVLSVDTNGVVTQAPSAHNRHINISQHWTEW